MLREVRLRRTQYRYLYRLEALVDDRAWLQGGLYVIEDKYRCSPSPDDRQIYSTQELTALQKRE